MFPPLILPNREATTTKGKANNMVIRKRMAAYNQYIRWAMLSTIFMRGKSARNS